MALGLDGYKAGGGSNPHYVDGKLLLRVSDITTMISVALVAIKVITGFRSAVNLQDIPRDFPSWAILAAAIAVMIQAYTSPALTGSVNWDASFHISHDAVSLSSVDPDTDFSSWLCQLGWDGPSTVDGQGRSTSGNGRRHVVNDIGLPRNSVLVHVTLPCINVSNICWHQPADELTGDEWSKTSGDDLTLVDDDSFGYYRAGATLAYDGNNLRHDLNTSDTSTATAQLPAANKFSGTMTVALVTARRTYSLDSPCEQLNKTKFGDMCKLPLPYLMETTRSTSANENCFLLGKIDFVAVTKSSLATYISPRVVEDITPRKRLQCGRGQEGGLQNAAASL
ncbi:hypothetical protein B0T26DRAFT_871197 [Lasiosphaeria miniovina]|uniref:Uncharacterized protein n=1 Tax=Lasiosphaeria miniovina TaxID=1954250 RepID=A0AA40AWN5_9PEZI|nr:uncharacterized protein B0T26DRAFT_871197 [Lasiosphaeria miniovina]KAK0723316.1 hypothetical protein B0T26DRAFT_871197 [Lasiosphaeria miniovina]